MLGKGSTAMRCRRKLAMLFAIAFLGIAAPAEAVHVPVEPPADAVFFTTDTYEFWVSPDEDETPWALVLSPDDGTDRGIILPADDPEYAEVDLGWLAAKYNHLGRFYWSACDYDEDTNEIVEGACSDPLPFYIRFRLSTLTTADARSNTRRVFTKLTRFALPRDGLLRCRRNSRTKQTCRVGTYIGDSVIYGRVVLWNKRPRGVRTYDLTRYRATLRIYDEYCHLVNKRPRRECDKPYKKRSGWTYRL